MKYIILIFCFVVSIDRAAGQQFLWSTSSDTTFKHVDINNATDEILKFYDQYDFYYDGSGYSKEGFIKMFESSASYTNASSLKWTEFKKRLLGINDPTIFAIRDNLGHGSVIFVFCISKENINMILFSNSIEKDAIFTIERKREKFMAWVDTLLN